MSFEVTATRKRPASFDTLVGQEFVVSTLKNALGSGHIAHAYLFSGPRGVGKTSSARLLAKALNCQSGPTPAPCGHCENCLSISKGNNIDVIEIDGASNTSVSDIRVIKEEILFPPTSSRYKIYIIDEVHMLSQSAFNALLKTIEEPPEYIIFIFATTELQKVPATIRSRCQQFNFRLLNYNTIMSQLKNAADETGIRAEDDALFWIAKESTGSMRDAYTLFDQVASFSGNHITMAKIRDKLGIVGIERINLIMEDIISDRLGFALEKLDSLLLSGVSIDTTIKDFAEYFRTILLIKKGITSPEILGDEASSYPEKIVSAYSVMQITKALEMFLSLYRDIRYSLNPRFELECAISKLGTLKYQADNAVVIEQIARLKNDLITGKITPLNKTLEDIPSVKPASAFDYLPKSGSANGNMSAAGTVQRGAVSGGPKTINETRQISTYENVQAASLQKEPLAEYASSRTQANNTPANAQNEIASQENGAPGFQSSFHPGSKDTTESSTPRTLAQTAGDDINNVTLLAKYRIMQKNPAHDNSAGDLPARISEPQRASSQSGFQSSAGSFAERISPASAFSAENSMGKFSKTRSENSGPAFSASGVSGNASEFSGEVSGAISEQSFREVNSPSVLYSKEDLQKALPPGVGNVLETPQGIELQYESKFFYQAAVKDISKIKENIRKVVGQNANVTISFSKELADKRMLEQKKKDEILQKEEERLAKSAYNNVSDLDAKDKNIFNEILHMFKGREEK